MYDLDLKEITLWAVDLATRAGEITLEYFRSGVAVESKFDESPVTVADKQTELFLRKEILAKFPDHSLVGEEFGNTEAAHPSPWSWTIDPIDGTKSFISNIPLYTVLLCLRFQEKPIIGVVHNPGLGETVWAWEGGGCWFNGNLTRLRPAQDLSKAWLQVTDPGHLLRLYPQTDRLLKDTGPVRTWADAYGYVLLVTGRADVMVDPRMNLWDVAPLVPIVQEAGGVITDLQGRPGAGDSCLAAGSHLHAQVLKYFK